MKVSSLSSKLKRSSSKLSSCHIVDVTVFTEILNFNSVKAKKSSIVTMPAQMRPGPPAEMLNHVSDSLGQFPISSVFVSSSKCEDYGILPPLY